uniref:MACPF domain-containing protein n=1 Tax=Strigamia maritima TaxID=126957 RepID=T1IZM3_STRMM
MDHFVTVWQLCIFLLCNSPLARSDGNHSTCPQTIYKLEALPGHGWDSIRNKEMGRALDFTYNQCRTTEDGKYLIPDSIYVVAIKDSTLQTTSEFIEHYMNYTSATSASLEMNAGFNLFGKIGVQGSFDINFLDAKSRQVNDKSMTTRIQARNIVYAVQAAPNAKIDPGLKSMLDQVIEAMELKNDEKAELLCQFIVQDYGTHYVYQANAGAILLEEDYIKSSFVSHNNTDRFEIKAAAGASFFKKIAGAKFSFSVAQAFQDQYEASKTSSKIRSIGGAPVTSNMTVDDWTEKTANNLVVIDRWGNPLSYLVNPERFPNVSVNTLNTVRKLLDQVIKDYYSYNTHYGCIDVNSPNFDYNANVDNNDCQHPSNAYSFGAGYMTCTSSSTDAGDLCENLNVKNPITGDFRCEDGFQAIPLTNNTLTSNKIDRKISKKCSGWWLWKKCWPVSNDVKKSSQAFYQGFWCISKAAPQNNTGVMFGGLFTSWMNNPLTMDRSCPVAFIPLRFAPDLQVCVSNSYDMGYQYSAPFAGFFSCQNGNPWTSALELYRNKNNEVPVKRNLLTCPNGFSQRLALVDKGCEINYCVKLQSTVKHIDIVLPPFRDQSALYVNTNMFQVLDAAKTDIEDSVSGGTIAGIVIGALAILVLVAVGAMSVKKRRQQRSAFILDDERDDGSTSTS